MTGQNTTKQQNSEQTPKRHRWADVIHAWAEGEEIQFKCQGDGQNYETRREGVPAFNCDEYQWRIKPKQQTGWINIYANQLIQTIAYVLHSTQEAALEASKHDKTKIACIQITWTEGEGL